jgi:[glutamine synthetase] adenylyltransferase / [glutamine synthetase]-adenylyl-L-tyrosine phosphorylase
VVREMTFHIGAQTLLGRCHPALLGRARARLADRVISAYVPAGLARTRAYAEEMIAGEFVVLALGKYGGAELGPRSDLDMIFVGIPHADSEEPGRFFNKAAQRLIGALTVPTEEGPMYDVDMKLRPMGAKGSLCTSLPFFTRYYEQDAWVWEFMALTRARIVAGRPKGRRILNEVLNRLALRHFDSDQLWTDAQSMRARVAENRSGRGVFDVKYADGGFVDIEFAVQVLLLAHSPQEGRRWPATLNDQISALARAGHLSPAEAGALDDAVTLLLATREVASLFGLERGEVLAPVAQAILAPWFDTDEEGFVERLSAAKARAGDIAHAILSGPR